MTQLRTDTAALELLKQSEAYQHGALQASDGKIDPNGPIPDPDPFAYDVYFLVAESTYHQPEGVSRQAISQHSGAFKELLQDASPTCLAPAIIVLEGSDGDAEGLELFLHFIRDPYTASEGRTSTASSQRQPRWWPKIIAAALTLCDKYDAPFIALLLRQHLRAADYAIDGAFEPSEPCTRQFTFGGQGVQTVCARFEAWVLGAQLGDVEFCGRMLSDKGGCDVIFWDCEQYPATGTRDPIDAKRGLSESYDLEKGQRRGVGGSLIFEVSSWPRQLNDIVPQSYSWALARAMQTVGAEYELKGFTDYSAGTWRRPKILRSGTDWTWTQCRMSFRACSDCTMILDDTAGARTTGPVSQ